MSVVSCEEQDIKLNWHPCAQMKDYEQFKSLVIKSASGSYFELASGQKIIDAISSWWCKSLGHNHPVLKQALFAQAEQFEHVTFANTTNDTILALSEKLTQMLPSLNKVYYAGDGSSAVEIALKMSLHARLLQGERGRKRFIALKNSYHGETIGALSVSDIGSYRDPYAPLLFPSEFVEVAYVSGMEDPLWSDVSSIWPRVEKLLAPFADSTTALIIEPIVQGAGGMKIVSKDFLSRLAKWAVHHNIHVIADEIMTGLGRTGKMLASMHANINPDFVCLGKSLSAGWMPFSAVLTTDEIYHVFYDDYDKGKAFLHSHTYSGNALAASIALAAFNIVEDSALCDRANQLQTIMMQYFKLIADKTGRLYNLRGIGGIVAADLIPDNNRQRPGYEVFRQAVKYGAFLRPLGNTIYWLPPLNTTNETLAELKDITEQAIVGIIV